MCFDESLIMKQPIRRHACPPPSAASDLPRPLLTENRLWKNWAILGQNAIPGQSRAD